MEPDSPIGDLYEDCEQCLEYSRMMGQLNKEMTSVTKKYVDLKKELERSEDPTMDIDILTQTMNSSYEQMESIRQDIRCVSLDSCGVR